VDVHVPPGREIQILLSKSIDASPRGSRAIQLYRRHLDGVHDLVVDHEIEVAGVLRAVHVAIHDITAEKSAKHALRLLLEGKFRGTHAIILPRRDGRVSGNDGLGVTPLVHTGSVSGFRFPDGVEFLGDDGDGHVSFSVGMPIDEDGFFGRECPECEQHFRIAHEDYDALPDDVRLWCVYCGHDDDHSEFLTGQQRDRLLRAAGDYAEQLVGRMFDDAFGGMARRTRGSMIQITYRSRPFYPAPLPEIDEEKLVRERTCAGCGLRYAVFGEHRFCPVCGKLSPLVTALDALDAETIRLQALADVPEPARSSLRESGVLHRTWVDTIENVVGIVEVFAERTFRAAVSDADILLKGKGKVFQRLDDFAELFSSHVGIDLRSHLVAEWPHLLRIWAARHVFTHCDGIVDAKYLTAAPGATLRAGQRLQITEAEARAAIAHTARLCEVLG
jgi:hypothetical protein